MKNNVTNLIIFGAGAAIGSVITWKLVKTKYERIADEEIEEVKEVFRKRVESTIEKYKAEDVNQTFTPEETKEYTNIIKDSGYGTSLKETIYGRKEGGADLMQKEKPYVISPDEFDELVDYSAFSLTYYAGDDVLTDEHDEPVEDVNYIVGDDFISHFGEYVDDAVFIRNDLLKSDYEILLVRESYYEKDSPQQVNY